MIKVKTTGEAGGLHWLYKGLIQLCLKAHEKFANRKCLLAAPLPGGGYIICPNTSLEQRLISESMHRKIKAQFSIRKPTSRTREIWN